MTSMINGESLHEDLSRRSGGIFWSLAFLPKATAVRGNCRNRGSALFLVLITLALLAVMGTVLIQTTRMDRMASETGGEGDIIPVVKSSVALIQSALRNDLLDTPTSISDTKTFNPSTTDSGGADESYDYPWTNTNDWPAAERPKLLDGTTVTPKGSQFDDTWLASTTPDFTSVATPAWPHLTNLTGVYLRIPKAGGSKDTPGDSGGEQVIDNTTSWLTDDTGVAITGTNSLTDNSDSDWEAVGVDADADGIEDSRWTWAPVRQANGVLYVMAVRIVDNSSMINLNTATGMTSDGAVGWGSEPPRGHSPAGVDLSRLFSRVRGASGTWSSELATGSSSLLERRTGLSASLPTAFGLTLSGFNPWQDVAEDVATRSRLDHWLNHGRRYRYGSRIIDDPPTAGVDRTAWKFNRDNEVELRLYGGLNGRDDVAEIESTLPTILRNSAAPEASFSDVDYATNTDTTSEERLAYFVGVDTSQSSQDATSDIDAREYPAVRHMLTTISGAASLAGNPGDIHGGAHTLKFDLLALTRPVTDASWSGSSATYTIGEHPFEVGDEINVDGVNPSDYDGTFDVTSKTSTTVTVSMSSNPGSFISSSPRGGLTNMEQLDSLYNLLHAIFTLDGPTTTNAYLGFDSSTDSDELEDIAASYAVSIGDYQDFGHTPNSYWIDKNSDGDKDDDDDKGEIYYGLEMLPFLREAYIQVGYDDQDLDDDDLDTDPDTGNFDTWQWHAGSQAIAVEIGNPFERQIDAALLNGRIRVVVVQLGVKVGNFILAGAGNLTSGSNLVLYSNPGSAVSEGGVSRSDLTDATDGLDLTGTPVDMGDGTFAFNADEEITVELQVLAPPGQDDTAGTADDWVTYDRLTASGFSLPASVAHTNNATRIDAHAQASVARDGRVRRYLSNTNVALVAGAVRLPEGVIGYRNTNAGNAVDALEDDTKGSITGDTGLDNFQIPIANRPFFSAAELGWIVMIGFHNGGDDDDADGLPDTELGDFPTRLTNLLADRRHLDVSPGAVVPDSTGLPHSAVVFDQVVLSHPRSDGLDNDRDASGDVDNDEEQFIPGTININTVPLHLATLAAPLPEAIDDVETLMASVLDYRDNPATADRVDTVADLTHGSKNNLRSQPGIASIGELLFVNPSAGDDQLSDMQVDGHDSPTSHPGVLDLFPLPETSITGHVVDDGAEEMMGRFQFFTQAFATRSDIFTAYVVIKGYPADDFQAGPVEVARYVAVFDRSEIFDGTGQVKLLEFYSY